MKALYRIILIGVAICFFTQPFVPAGAGSFDRIQTSRVPTKVALRPDLIVSAIDLTRDCRIKVTLKNKGAGGVTEAAYDRKHGLIVQATSNNAGWGGYLLFIVDPHQRLKKPGASVSYVGFKRALNPGERLTLKVALLDPKNSVKESNTKNNSLTRRLGCGKPGQASIRSQRFGQVKTPPRLAPDLTITMMKITPTAPTTEDTIRFSAYVTNIGAATAPASKAGIRIGGETYPMLWNKPAITPQSSNAIVRLKRIERPGRYRVTFIADASNAVAESNENNNDKYLEFTVRERLPDITLKDAEIKPANPTTNDMIHFTARVINIGEVESGPLSCGVRVGGESQPYPGYYGGIPVDSPQAQKFAVARGLRITRPGNYVVRFVVDTHNQVKESDETNNQITLHFTVQ